MRVTEGPLRRHINLYQLSPKEGSDLLVIPRAVLLGYSTHNDKYTIIQKSNKVSQTGSEKLWFLVGNKLCALNEFFFLRQPQLLTDRC